MHYYCFIHCSLDGVHSVPGSPGVRGRVVQQEGAQGQDADRPQGRRDQDGQHGQGQDLGAHRLPLLLAVLDAVVQKYRTQGG